MTFVLALASGILLGLSFPKFGHPSFAWVALAPLLVALGLEHASGRRRGGRFFWLGFIMGVVASAITLYWVIGTMATYGGFDPWLAYPIAGALWLAEGAHTGLFAWVTGRSIRRFGVGGVWWAPPVWVCVEWMRSWFFIPFPWNILGTSQASVLPVVQFTALTGVYGLSLLIVFVSAAAAAVTLSRRAVHVRGAMAVGGALILIVAGGIWRLADNRLTTSGRPLTVGVVQGSIAQDVKWDRAYENQILERHMLLSRQVLAMGAALVIWPESSTPFYFNAEGDRARPIRQLAADSRTPFLIGTDDLEPNPGGQPAAFAYNAAVLIGANGRTRGVYRKMYLVPFGEYVPMQKLLFFVGPLVQSVSDFKPGAEPTVLDDGAGTRLSTAICYESVYPSLARAFVQRGAELLTILTNDAWFGTSSAAYQHFEQGAVRAVEEGRYIVRAANTGLSGVVDPYGRVLHETHLFEATGFVATVRLLNGRTIYSYIGDIVAWASAAIMAGLIFLTSRRFGVAP